MKTGLFGKLAVRHHTRRLREDMSQTIGPDSECTANEGAEHWSDPKHNLSSDGDFVRYWSRAADRLRAVAAVGRRTEEAIGRTGIGLQLSSENFNGHDLSDFPLRRCTLNRAQLYGAKLDRADLSGANLICPGLERASFRGAKLDFAYMHVVHLR